jgi:hypothetical protein
MKNMPREFVCSMYKVHEIIVYWGGHTLCPFLKLLFHLQKTEWILVEYGT